MGLLFYGCSTHAGLGGGYRAASPRRGGEPQGRLVHSGYGSDKGL